MSVKNFIPTVWSTRLLKHLESNLVYGDVVNTEYEGEIRGLGDTVKINQVGSVTISDYSGTLAPAEELTSTQKTLKIDRVKSFNFKVEDIDKAQANVSLLDKGLERAGRELQSVVDLDIADAVEDAGIEVGTALAPIELTVETTYDEIVDLAVALDEADVSRSDRFVILPPFALGLLSKDPRFTRDAKVLENGIVEGQIAGFEVRQSNNVPLASEVYSVLAGSKSAIAFAGQFSETEAYRPENSFSDAVKGLYVYGLEVIQPEALVKFSVKKA